jgi:hypothetical protein
VSSTVILYQICNRFEGGGKGWWLAMAFMQVNVLVDGEEHRAARTDLPTVLSLPQPP